MGNAAYGIYPPKSVVIPVRGGGYSKQGGGVSKGGADMGGFIAVGVFAAGAFDSVDSVVQTIGTAEGGGNGIVARIVGIHFSLVLE